MSQSEKKDRRPHEGTAAIRAAAVGVMEATPAGMAPVATTRPDPEVVERPVRRTFTAEFKRRIVEEAAAGRTPGDVGALLRRHGLYSSHLVAWRRQWTTGALAGLAPRKRGRKAPTENPLAPQVAKLEREKAGLERRLQQAEPAPRPESSATTHASWAATF